MQSFNKNSFFPIETQGLVVQNKEEGLMQKIVHEPGWKMVLLLHYKGQNSCILCVSPITLLY